MVVVGGGLAGLTCAERLARAGHDAEVFEAEPVAGGRVSEAAGAERADRGYCLAASDRSLADLVRRTGVAPGAREGRASWRTRLGQTLQGREALRIGARLILQAREREPGDADERDFAHVLRALAPRTYEAWLARAAAVHGIEPVGLSSALGFDELREAVEGGRPLESTCVAALVPALESRVSVRLGFEVVRVEAQESGVELVYVTPSGERSRHADAVVLAVPADRALALCASLCPAERGWLGSVRYAPGLQLVAGPFEELASGDAMAWIPPSADVPLSAIRVEPGPEGVKLRLLLRPDAARKALADPDATILDSARAALARVAPSLALPEARVHRFERERPEFGPGACTALRAFRARRERTPRLVFAGDATIHPSLEGAVRSGQRAAQEIVEALAASAAS